MIKTYNTAVTAAPAGGGAEGSAQGGSNTLLWVVVAGVAIWAGYQFIYKPYVARKAAEQTKTQ
jgi:hypothetical protein